MIPAFNFQGVPDSVAADELRGEVRAFIATELAGVPAIERARSWTGADPVFSSKMGKRGWIGMTWPPEYGGAGRSLAERYVVVEEMLAAGAPVGAHWIADRQTGPLLLRFGTEEQRHALLPRIAAGELYTCIGMSEPDVGSDLAAVRTRAEPVDGGFRINGTKLWTTNAHRAHYMLLFCRTESGSERHNGTSQLLVDLTLPGIIVRPIVDLTGESHFNEVTFQDVNVPRAALVGEQGNGWAQVMSELSYERSGPERFLSSMTLLIELLRRISGNASLADQAAVGRLVAHLASLRQMSRGVADRLERGEDPSLEAAVVKDLGAKFEQDIPDVVRQLIEANAADPEFRNLLAYMVCSVPAYSLRGGTRQILRGIIARGLGLR